MAKVLVVDDHASIRLLLTMALEDRGHECDQAQDGSEALSKMASHAYDVVVLDMMMPAVNGLDVLEKMRPGAESPLILMYTARRDPETANLAKKLGATGVIIKTADPDDVAKEVERYLDAGDE